MKHVTVQGAEVPAIGLGTWRIQGQECYRAVSTALEAGYRHVDTAQAYRNHRKVGEALSDAPVDRDEVFLTTKVFPGTATDYATTRAAATDCLEELGVDYVDLLLIHWPSPLADLEEQLRAFADLYDDELARHVGVSNFGPRLLRRARSLADVPLLTDQVQFHPFQPQRELLRYCQDNDLLLTAYSPLGHGGALHDDLLAEIGERHDRTAAQVALRWAIQHKNVAAIPKSTSPAHIRDNLAVFDFSLTREELDAIARESGLRTGLSWVRGRLGV